VVEIVGVVLVIVRISEAGQELVDAAALFWSPL
jgi:hypothetical protein